MRFETRVDLIKQKLVDDGMGGFIESDEHEIYWNFDCYKLPVKAETLLEEYGITSTKAVKFITRDDLPDEIQLLQEPFNDFQKYELLQLMDYGKYRLLLVEEVDKNV